MAHSRSSSTTSSPNPPIFTSISQCENAAPKTLYRPPTKQPSGLSWAMNKTETMFSYVWLVIQILLLVAGLTVLHFSTLMVTLSYFAYGKLKGRREFQS